MMFKDTVSVSWSLIYHRFDKWSSLRKKLFVAKWNRQTRKQQQKNNKKQRLPECEEN